MKQSRREIIVKSCIVAALAVWLGCSSRYRLDLTVTERGVPNRVKVEQTQFATGAVLGNPMSEVLIEQGNANCFVVTAGARGKKSFPSGKYDVFQYDDHLQYRILLQIPAELESGHWSLENRSFVEVAGRYELPREEKVFSPSSGTFAVDSVAHKRAFVTIDGEFKSASGAVVEVKGRFKVKVK